MKIVAAFKLIRPLLIALAVQILPAQTAVPAAVNYSARLTDANSVALADGIGYELEVRIWSAATGGTLIWGARYTGIAAKAGAVNLVLGSTGGVALAGASVTDITAAFAGPQRFIGITVTKNATGQAVSAPSEILPRQQLLTVPYAAAANTAKTAEALLNPVVSVPTGLIAMWSGTIATIPSGWALCDGTNGTPDLRDRFVVGATSDNAGVAKSNVTGALTQSGGTAQHTHTGTTSAFSIGTTRIDDNSGGSDHDWMNPGGHTHTFTTSSSIHVPPYYALAFIMKR